MENSTPRPNKLTGTHWLILTIASLGFAFDIYELLMMPLIARPALGELLGVDPATTDGNAAILRWTGYIQWGSAICGGTFGLLGGYLTDLFGRRRVLVWSILLYAGSAFAAGFSTSPAMLLVLRCTTFIGVCVEFVAAVAWLSELFPDPRQREAALGYTQAFSSVGGLMVTGMFKLLVAYSSDFPDWLPFQGPQAFWRYTLMSGLIPAIPLIVIRPFLPESPAWHAKRAAGTLKRPSLAALFRPEFLRTTVVTTILFACGYGAAFGAIQLMPQIVPGLVAGPVLAESKQKLQSLQTTAPETEEAQELRDRVTALERISEIPKLRKQLDAVAPGSDEFNEIKAQIGPALKTQQDEVANVQLFQEFGGLAGRFALAWLALRIVSRRALLRFFQLPGLLLIPLVFFIPAGGHLAESNLDILRWGMFLAGFFTVAQFSFWGNYLPRMYPVHLRGTGESFAANVGGRMVGTSANLLTTTLAPLVPVLLANSSLPGFRGTAYASGAVALFVYAAGSIACFWLPEPKQEALPE